MLLIGNTFLYSPDQGMELQPLNAEFSYRRPQEVEATPQQPNSKYYIVAYCRSVVFVLGKITVRTEHI